MLAAPSSTVVAESVCPFDATTLSFVGSVDEQARCLLRPVGRFRRLGDGLDRLPRGLAGLPGTPVEISREAFRAVLMDAEIVAADLGGSLDRPLSRSNTNHPEGLPACYFVIHDTSTPNLLDADFPEEMSSLDWPHNDRRRWGRGSPKAHVFINRLGASLTALDFEKPWRATRLEVSRLGVISRGRFLHVELIQPRRSASPGPPGNDALAPDPGFTDPQLERLALVYVAASVRAGIWLIPAFHAVVDDGIPGAHDDPQKFDLERWSSLLGELVHRLSSAESPAEASLSP